MPPGGPVTITWFCCLGGGDEESQQKTFKELATAFEATHPNIKLMIDHTAYEGARDAFAVKLASGNPPDVVGPLGIGGAAAFEGQWLDLQPYVDKNNVDLTGYDQTLLQLYKPEGEGLVGIPFAIYPSELYYQLDMFDEAGLEYPPASYGEQYKMPDGTMVDWNYDTLRQIAMLLTIDKAARTRPRRDSTRPRSSSTGSSRSATTCEPSGPPSSTQARLLADDGKTAQIPDAWRAAWHWVYDGIWKDHFIMTRPGLPDARVHGRLRRLQLGQGRDERELPVVRVLHHRGRRQLEPRRAARRTRAQVTAPINADTFRITKDSKHPDEAFEFLRYLVQGEGKTKMLNAISGFPALTADQPSFFDQLEQQVDDKGKAIYPADVNWDVSTAAIPLADVEQNSSPRCPTTTSRSTCW